MPIVTSALSFRQSGKYWNSITRRLVSRTIFRKMPCHYHNLG